MPVIFEPGIAPRLNVSPVCLSPALQASAMADEALYQLGRLLRQRGYRFTTVTPLSHERVNQRPGNEWAKDFQDIFGWSRPFHQELLDPPLFDLMSQAGVLRHEGDAWRSTVRWSSLGSELYVHSAFPTEADDAVFFGPDTYRFAQLIDHHLQSAPRSIDRAVDIGCGAGPGAARIALAHPEAQVLGLDINSLALRYTTVNARLNGLDNVLAERSDLLHDVGGHFDLIVANPPYMLDATLRAYRHGGGDLGAGLSLNIIDNALSRLSLGGSLVLYTGVAIVAGVDPFLIEVSQRLIGHDCSWRYRELDPDVFGEELLNPAYANVDRIAAVALIITRES